MKKTLLLALAAVATIFTSCSSDINNDNDDLNNGQGKGMTLIANVEQPDTRATLDPSVTFGTWKFAYTDNDKVEVGNDQINNYYTFTKSGENFSSTEAQATNSDANWYAYYPGTTIDLTNQAGTEASAAELYALAGATTTATTGADGLKINMKAKAAVLRIVKVDNYGPCDIYLMTKEGKYVKGLKAKKNAAGFEVETSETRTSVFYKESSVDYKENKGNSGIYYVIVPAGVKISVYNDEKLINTTKEAGLTAGRYYTLTSGPTKGTARATFADGKTEPVEWVQMWIGGPRIATKNAADKMSWTDALKTGDNFVWGKNWHNPSLDDVKVISKDGAPNTDILDATYEYNNNKHGFTLKGKQPEYTHNTVFLSGKTDKSDEKYLEGKFWLTDEKVNGYATTMNFEVRDGKVIIYPFTLDYTTGDYESRPVLTIDTVLWGEQDIK